MTTPQEGELDFLAELVKMQTYLIGKADDARIEDNLVQARDNTNAAMTIGKEVLKLREKYDLLISPDQVSALYELRHDTILMAILEAAPDRAGDILTQVRKTDVKAFADLSARISKMRVFAETEPFELDDHTNEGTDLAELIKDLRQAEEQIKNESK
jgi:hypothetical protein